MYDAMRPHTTPNDNPMITSNGPCINCWLKLPENHIIKLIHFHVKAVLETKYNQE